jgi:branched-subunit amino acid aminotransferase/4-amino-4-deoxychorismate lyase
VGIGAIRKCEEAFMTNAVIEIMPVKEVTDEKGSTLTIGAGKPGAVTQKLMAAYRERVEKATAGQ